jgi:hypothetical protein
LQEIFDEVTYMTPQTIDVDFVAANRIPVVCDNHRVMDWPGGFPVIGFQHGVGAVKFSVTHSYHHWKLARAQKKASSRPDTLWVADAQWVSEAHARMYGNGASHVIYHSIDVEHFDGVLDNRDSKLILHDARTRHKGKKEIEQIARAFPEWSFEQIDCPLGGVPDRMRTARAFMHLSRYEGFGIVFLEAMAMNLPCLFTRVGLMLDQGRPDEVTLVEPEQVFGDRQRLISVVGDFLDALHTRSFQPRRWILEHATFAIARASWRRALIDFEKMSGWPLNLPA